MLLSPSRQSFYQQFNHRLQQLTEEARSQSSQEVSEGVTRNWMETIAALQAEFQTNILESSVVEADQLTGRIRSIETEIFRVLKLLPTDFLFLKSAKQPPTLRLRHQQFCDRLTAATAYSQSLLAIASPPPSSHDDDPINTITPDLDDSLIAT
jgi:hypothetical protein